MIYLYEWKIKWDVLFVVCLYVCLVGPKIEGAIEEYLEIKK